MGFKKGKTIPTIVTFIILATIVYLFANIKQTKVICEKAKIFDSGIKLKEEVISTLDGKKINQLEITKTINLPEKYSNDPRYLEDIKKSLDNTLEYLGNKVKYTISTDSIIVKIDIHKNELVMLDNIEFIGNENWTIRINSNTKSSNAITLSIGDNYTDGEFMKRLKKNGYSCK